jgi:6-phosphogluconate dehydrogenase
MEIGFVGLGKMGSQMVERLLADRHKVVAIDLSETAKNLAARKGAVAAVSLPDLAGRLKAPRAVWIMVPAGTATEETIDLLASLLEKGDLIIDGGNSHYQDSLRRSDKLRKNGISFLDVGTSGGIRGLTTGFCLMIGGEKAAFEFLEPIFRTLAPKGGYARVGGCGAGHFVKMVHNGIEYALLQAYSEGFELLEAKKEFGFDLAEISRLWNQGSVIRSWLLELAEEAFNKNPHLEGIKGYVADSGEGRWTVFEAIDRDVPVPVIALSLLERFRSRQEESFSAKVIAALRNEFGGHEVKKK